MKKKELLIILILAVLMTVLSGFLTGGLPCVYYWDPNLLYEVHPCFRPCSWPIMPLSFERFLCNIFFPFIPLGIHGLFTIDLLFWFVVLTAGWEVVKLILRKAKKK